MYSVINSHYRYNDIDILVFWTVSQEGPQEGPYHRKVITLCLSTSTANQLQRLDSLLLRSCAETHNPYLSERNKGLSWEVKEAAG